MTGEGSVLYDVYVLGQAVNELLVDGLADAPLTPSEYAVYSAIFERGPATPSELRHSLGMPAQTMSDWIALLRERGHAESRRNPRDGRSQLVSLTPAGRRAHRLTNGRSSSSTAGSSPSWTCRRTMRGGCWRRSWPRHGAPAASGPELRERRAPRRGVASTPAK